MVYLNRAPIWQNRYFYIRVETIKHPLKFLPECQLKRLLVYGEKNLKRMDHYFSKSIFDLSTAIKYFREVGDKDSISYCLNNMTGYYISSYKFIPAFITFKKLESSIKGSKDKELLRHFEELKNRLRNGNRNIPDYTDKYKEFMTV